METGFFIGVTAVAIALCIGLGWVAFFTPPRLLAFALGGGSVEPNDETGDDGDSAKATGSKQKSAGPRVTVQVHQSAMHPHSAATEDQENGDNAKEPRGLRRGPEIAIAVFAGCSFIVAVVQAVIAVQAISEAERANSVAVSALTATKISAKATEDYAEQSKEANRIARDTERKQLRAYMGSGDTPTIDYDEKTLTVTATVLLKNTGQTPAHGFNGVPCMIIESSTYDGPFDLCTYDENVKFTIASGVSRPLYRQIVLRPIDVAELKSGAKVIWLFGEVKYRDIFGDNHFTRFRLYSGRLFDGAIGFGVAWALNGNDAD